VPPVENTQALQEQVHTSPLISDPPRASPSPVVTEAVPDETPEQVNGEQVNVEYAYPGGDQVDDDRTQEHSPPQEEIQPDDIVSYTVQISRYVF